jgi:hypothetical protein
MVAATRATICMGLVVSLAGCIGLSGREIPAPGFGRGVAGTEMHLSHSDAPELSPAALRVARIAVRKGDGDFLLLDKAHGKNFLFQNGRPVFGGAALTGEYPADQLAPDALGKTSHEQVGLKYKVTPAGRFTVSKGNARGLGPVLDINEIRGKDWGIAIHRVWSGAPAEHRAARLRSSRDRDKHITYGCIDVDAPTMQRLDQILPNNDRIPLYITPQDESLIATLF